MKRATNPKRTPASGAAMKSPASISQDEWDFSKVPDAELDACFYYEFARASNLIKEGIAAWRAGVPNLAEIKVAWLNAPTSTRLPGTMKHSDEGEFEKWFVPCSKDQEANAAKPDNLTKIDERILDFVASLKEFPNVSWQMLSDIALKATHAKDFKVPDRKDTGRETWRCLIDQTGQLPFWESLGLSACKIIHGAERHKSNVPIKLTHHLFGLSWNYSDDELVAAFRSWVNKNRPPQFPESKIQDKRTGISWQPLPVGKRTALEYLGVYRRKQICTWPVFVKQWPESQDRRSYRVKNADQKTEGEPEKAADLSRISQLKGQCAKAKEIIAVIEG